MDKLYIRVMDAIEAQPWKTRAEIANIVGSSSGAIGVTLWKVGTSFEALKVDRIKELHHAATLKPQGEVK